MSDGALVVLGCGYIGSRLARAALAAGRPVRACARGVGKLAPLAELGAEVLAIDATKPKQFNVALRGTSGATVVYAIPQLPDQIAGETVQKAAQAAKEGGARTFIYLGTAGLYGKRPEDYRQIDETDSVVLDDGQMTSYLKDESALQGAAAGGLRTVVLRMAAVYGIGRGVRTRLRKGDYKLIDDGAHWISRIHVDDLVQIILACEEQAPAGAVYLVGDDRPTSQREYTEWLCGHLGVAMPPSATSPGGISTMRARYLKNDLVKRELGITLRYPSYLEGEAQIDAEEAAAAL